MNARPRTSAFAAGVLGAALLDLCGVACFADAQATPTAAHSLRVGDRVRLTAPTVDAFPILGFVVSDDGSRLRLDVAKPGETTSERSIDWEAVTRIERSTGYRSNAGRGAWTGLGLGVLAGAGLWFLAANKSGDTPPPLSTPLWYGGLGALFGTMIGSGSSSERWIRLPLENHAELPLGASSESLAVGVPDSAHRSRTRRSVLAVGDRVRLTAPTQPPSPAVGRLTSADDSQVTIVVAEETRMAPAVKRTFDRESLTRIERSEADKSKVGTGALIGGTLGVVTGVAVGFAAAMGSEDGSLLFTSPLIFGSMGLLAGAGAGAAFSGERWTELPGDARVGLQIGAPSLPIAVGVRASF